MFFFFFCWVAIYNIFHAIQFCFFFPKYINFDNPKCCRKMEFFENNLAKRKYIFLYIYFILHFQFGAENVVVFQRSSGYKLNYLWADQRFLAWESLAKVTRSKNFHFSLAKVTRFIKMKLLGFSLFSLNADVSIVYKMCTESRRVVYGHKTYKKK